MSGFPLWRDVAQELRTLGVVEDYLVRSRRRAAHRRACAEAAEGSHTWSPDRECIVCGASLKEVVLFKDREDMRCPVYTKTPTTGKGEVMSDRIPEQDWLDFRRVWRALEERIVANAKAKGFDSLQHEGIGIALMHSELSEALEAYRHGNPPSEHIPSRSGVEEELADLVIRVMDHAAARGHNVVEAIMLKIEFNESRPQKHGGKRY